MNKDIFCKKIKKEKLPVKYSLSTQDCKLYANLKNYKLIAIAIDNFEDYCHEYSKCQNVAVHEVECILFTKNLIEDAIEYSNSNKVSKLLKNALAIPDNEITTDCWKKLLSYSSNPQSCSELVKNKSEIAF